MLPGNQQKSGARGKSVLKWAGAVFVVLLVVAVLGGVKYTQIKSAMAAHMGFSMPPESVTTFVVSEQKWPGGLSAVGSLKPVDGLLMRADLAGNVESIGFESGVRVKKGQLLVQQDVSEEQAQLRAAEARQRLAELNLQRLQGLLSKRVSSQSDYDQTASEFLSARAKCEEIKAVIEKKTIRAPFDGVAGIRVVNAGEYLQPGNPIVPLQSMSPIFVNFSIPQQNLADISVGSVVRVTSSGANGRVFEGKITAVDSVVDEATRNFLVQGTLENPDGLLRPGMFVGVEVVLPVEKALLAIPATSVSYAPYGDSVFVVQEMKDPKSGKSYRGVAQHFVKLGEARGDLVEVLSGIGAGDEVVTSGVFKLRPNAAVEVNNEVRPPESLAPQPKDQ
ncbi:MAG: efflux RND transporter periplasmic adaptor subunit [Verrucomicrobiaceae bacterium]|nr:MAG: efflux RND transporter periplasmic adaptor subunit [Verrucomicrobiaceae bacterium]